MIEFTVGDHTYRAEKLVGFDQFHLSRRVAPLIPPLLPVFNEVMRNEGKMSGNLDALGPLLQPFADALSEMKDHQVEEILKLCMAVVKRKSGETWQSIWAPGSRMPMFDDLNDMGTQLKIVVEVVRDNLGPFIQGLLTSQQAEKAAA